MWGTANPEGMKDSYRGVYLNRSDIAGMVEQVKAGNAAGAPIPVKLEHTGAPMVRVVSAWESGGRLECVLEVDENTFEGSIGSAFVQTGVCKDLSLGYTIDMEQSKGGKFESRRKRLNEVSMVVKGARHNCHVKGFSARPY